MRGTEKFRALNDHPLQPVANPAAADRGQAMREIAEI
jgi:hypothetical protein